MTEAGGGFDLAEKPLPPEGGGELRRQHLDRHRATVLQVLSEVDRRHPATAEFALDRVANGLPTCATVGLPQGAVKEGRERVYAALANTGYTFPLKRITVNLAPADIRKDGSAFDLPIAVGILAATEQISAERLGRVAVLGELGLEGAIRPVRGALPVALTGPPAGAGEPLPPRRQ